MQYLLKSVILLEKYVDGECISPHELTRRLCAEQAHIISLASPGFKFGTFFLNNSTAHVKFVKDN